MCGGIPNSSTLGPKPKPTTFWEAVKQAWRELRK